MTAVYDKQRLESVTVWSGAERRAKLYVGIIVITIVLRVRSDTYDIVRLCVRVHISPSDMIIHSSSAR